MCLSGCPQATIDAIIMACKGNPNCTASQCTAPSSASSISMSLVAVVAALVARFY
jgi:hypothetical protein